MTSFFCHEALRPPVTGDNRQPTRIGFNLVQVWLFLPFSKRFYKITKGAWKIASQSVSQSVGQSVVADEVGAVIAKVHVVQIAVAVEKVLYHFVQDVSNATPPHPSVLCP